MYGAGEKERKFFFVSFGSEIGQNKSCDKFALKLLENSTNFRFQLDRHSSGVIGVECGTNDGPGRRCNKLRRESERWWNGGTKKKKKEKKVEDVYQLRNQLASHHNCNFSFSHFGLMNGERDVTVSEARKLCARPFKV